MRIGVMGCGSRGYALARGAVESGFEVAACADPSRRQAAAFAKKFGAKAMSWDALLKRDRVDVAVVASPTAEHPAQINAAAEAGLHLVVAAPICRTAVEAKKAMAAARRAGVRLVVACHDPHRTAIDAMRAQYASGRIGRAGFLRCVRREPPPLGERNWFWDEKAGGGVLLNFVQHDVEWLVKTFGEPERVFCQRSRHAKEYVECVLATLKFCEGPIVQLVVLCSESHPARTTVEICGDKGMIQYDSEDRPSSHGMGLELYRAIGAPWLAMRSGAASYDDNDSVLALRVVEAMERSVASGKPIKLKRAEKTAR